MVLARAYAAWSINIHVADESVVVSLIRRDYRPNGTLCNADWLLQQYLDAPVDPAQVHAAVARCVALCGVPAVSVDCS